MGAWGTSSRATSPTRIRPEKFDNINKLICRFWGGKKWKNENWKLCKDPAIKGLNSNWITDKIIASQRLSDRLIEEFDIVQQFKDKNVAAIFNLQEPGEHPVCGDGLVNDNIGFSYTPEKLQANGISVYHLHWEDLTNPKISEVLKNVKLMDFHIKKGQGVLVHCHAGQGRTGLIIAAYLLYCKDFDTTDATIKFIRSKRKKWLKKGYNRNYLGFIKTEFDKLTQIFPDKTTPLQFSIKEIIENQKKWLHGPERIKYMYIPKVLDLCLNKLFQLADGDHVDYTTIVNGFTLHKDVTEKYKFETELQEIKDHINHGKYDLFYQYASEPKILGQLFVDFWESLSSQIITLNWLDEVGKLYTNSLEKADSHDNVKALHEIFEEDAKINPKKVLFTILFKVTSFVRIFRDTDHWHLMIDRILVALLQRKRTIMEQCFVGRSMISSASEEDTQVSSLSTIIKSILMHDTFEEFATTPMKSKPKLITINSDMNHKNGFTSPMMTMNERRVKKFMDKLDQLADNDRELYLHKIDSFSKDIEEQVMSVRNSPVFPKVERRHLIEESGNVGDDNFGKF